ncbi:CotS family spore coat protein [Paenibacillus sp. GCM10027627]|uniref:CotS family spore coat protein n=1 Tax=unclassified Paenibacillus TaxID=185978 RepID=UPI003626BCCA
MEQYQIVPWDNMLEEEESGLNLEQYVPPELEQLAHQVCKSYDMSVSGMTLITSKPDKGGAIWRIETNKGPRSLKVLHRTPQRSLFSVGAQQYVVENGARVPGIIPTHDGRNSVVAGGKLWIVTDWIDTLTPVAKIDLDGAMTLCHGLGEFHKWSKGYVPPLDAGKSTRIFKWEGQYQKIMAKIGWFRHIASVYPETAASPQLLSVLDMFETQAKDIFTRFQASAYSKMIRKGEAHWGLAHQDYGWSNGQMGPGGIWVIDLDGVAFDIPIRDLRKIITSTMDDMGAWDLAWIRGVIDAYHRANPLDQETFELLWIDMAFPNEFYKHVKEVVFHPVEFMNTELGAILDRVVATEANKWEVLKELEKDKANYPAGDYPEAEEVVRGPYSYRDYAKRGQAVPGTGRSDTGEQDTVRKGKKVIRLVVNPDGKAVIIPGPGVEYESKKNTEKLKKEKKKVQKVPVERKKARPALLLPIENRRMGAVKPKLGKKKKAAKAEEAKKLRAIKPKDSRKLSKEKERRLKEYRKEKEAKQKDAKKRARQQESKKSAAVKPPGESGSKAARQQLKLPALEAVHKWKAKPPQKDAKKLVSPVKGAPKSRFVPLKPHERLGKGRLASSGTKPGSGNAFISAYRNRATARENSL